MLRKDLRSMVLSLVLGDGCLHYIKYRNGMSGGLTISHGMAQADYQKWKAELLTTILKRDVKVRSAQKGTAVQLSVCMKRFRSWRKFCYPNGTKDVSKILRFINNPEFAAAVWLMDDGYVEPSISKLKSGEKVLYGARFRIFTCETPVENQGKLIEWFQENLSIVPYMKIQKNKSKNTEYPFLKMTQEDSLILWEKIRDFVLQFKSMRYKFRHIETIYQKRITQRSIGEK